MEEIEFNLPDETRLFDARLERCPVCNQTPHLLRYGGGDSLEITFRIQCPNFQGCKTFTPYLKSSRLAIRHWQLAAKLGKL